MKFTAEEIKEFESYLKAMGRDLISALLEFNKTHPEFSINAQVSCQDRTLSGTNFFTTKVCEGAGHHPEVQIPLQVYGYYDETEQAAHDLFQRIKKSGNFVR